MVQAIIPVIILATVALSSSTILPMLYKNLLNTEIDLDGQENDNILSNKLNSINLKGNQFLNAQYDARGDPNVELDKTGLNLRNDEWTQNVNLNKKENYNGEGFRQEQWHNYPRQLDRLRKYLYEYYNIGKKGLNTNERNEDGTEEEIRDEENPETIYNKGLDQDINKQYDPGSINPELKKIQFVLNNNIEPLPQVQLSKNMETQANRGINPDFTLLKVKRDDSKDLPGNELGNSIENKVVAKRIFSLWSRLQGLNHNRGHELHHRRHLHAFYGLPDSDGGGTLTAETRATFMRPPGSPLRWG